MTNNSLISVHFRKSNQEIENFTENELNVKHMLSFNLARKLFVKGNLRFIREFESTTRVRFFNFLLEKYGEETKTLRPRT